MISARNTVKFLNFRTPENFAVIFLKFKQRGQTLQYFIKTMQMEWQTVKTLIRLLLEEQSDLGLHFLPIPICPIRIKREARGGVTSYISEYGDVLAL